MESPTVGFEYEWEPFLFEGRHLTFEEHRHARLSRPRCSHWGAAVYKWEGVITEGKHDAQVGVLIGETGDLRQRIKQYISGTQEAGNKYWRDQFLTRGNLRLFVLRFPQATIHTATGESETVGMVDLVSDNLRLVLEQVLVWRGSARRSAKRWIINRRL